MLIFCIDNNLVSILSKAGFGFFFNENIFGAYQQLQSQMTYTLFITHIAQALVKDPQRLKSTDTPPVKECLDGCTYYILYVDIYVFKKITEQFKQLITTLNEVFQRSVFRILFCQQYLFYYCAHLDLKRLCSNEVLYTRRVLRRRDRLLNQHSHFFWSPGGTFYKSF